MIRPVNVLDFTKGNNRTSGFYCPLEWRTWFVIVVWQFTFVVAIQAQQASISNADHGDMVVLASNSQKPNTAAMHAIAHEVVASPWPYSAVADCIRIHSLKPIDRNALGLPLLESLRHEIAESLDIRVAHDPIDVVVLDSQSSLETYAKRMLPAVPSRRALYIRHRGPGLVITYLHPEWIQDARHECTHAILDASGLQLPLWQDEGLAEYFETVNRPPTQHAHHYPAICSQVRFGQIADIKRLESLSPQLGMEAKDYRDAWSIVAFLLNASPETKKLYCDYLKDVQDKRAAGFLSHRSQSVLRTWHISYSDFFRRGK
jgi:hypothetical protein